MAQRRALNSLVLLGLLQLFVGTEKIYGDESTDLKVANLINDFTIRFYKELVKNSNDNQFSSGFSLDTVLNMLLTGANSDTATELRTVLGYESAGLTQEQVQDSYHSILEKQRRQHEGYDLNVANSLWIRQGFNILPQYTKTIKETYYAEVREVLFGSQNATDEINEWVSKETGGKIQKLFEKTITPDMVLILANALYFKGTWKNKFDKELTEDYPFIYNNSTTSQKTKMMNILHTFRFTECKVLNAQILEIPYDGDEVSMMFVLPLAVDGLTLLEQQLTLEILNNVIDLMSDERVHVKIPKFNTSTSLDLIPILQSMGINKALSPGVADFSGINGNRDLFVSLAIQKAIIEVSENGTEAAAVSAIGMGRSLPAPKTKEYFFVADHPFLYFIVHNPTQVILFMGRMKKP